MDPKLTRRDLLVRGSSLGAMALLAGSAAACSKSKAPLACTDTSALSAADLSVRTSLQYVDISTEPGKMCSNCQQFLPAAADQCGACKVVKGPINPGGYCKSFTAKAT